MRNANARAGFLASLVVVVTLYPGCSGTPSHEAHPSDASAGGSSGAGSSGTGSSGTGSSGVGSSSGGSSGGSSSGGSSSGGSSGGSSSGGSSSATTVNNDGAAASGSSSGGGPVGDAGACLGASVLTAVGKSHMLIGATMADATAAMAPFDLRYEYLSGGLFDGTAPCTSCASGCTVKGTTCANSGPGCAWWGCYQYDQDPPGAFVRNFVAAAAKTSPPELPMFTYYQLLQGSGVKEGAAEVTQAANTASFMSRYFADWRFLLKQVGQSSVVLHIEPDFWGYAEQQGSNPHSLNAAVASANPTDCASMENSIAGMGQCMVSMVRTYAPHALVGLHASAWSTNIDVAGNTSATLDVAGEAAKTAAFLAACGESSADLIIVETSDRDAGYYQTVQNKNTFWDATNATLPDFHQDFAWVKALTEALGKPALYWQTPLGNASQNNTANHYKDNRVDYFFAHMSELAAAHAIGAAFGAGAGDQTSPESDGGNFVSKAKAYFSGAGGGQSLCGP